MSFLDRRLAGGLRKRHVRLIVHDAPLGGTVAILWLLIFGLDSLSFLSRHVSQIGVLEIFLSHKV